MVQEKVVSVELGSVFSSNPVVENYVARVKSLKMQGIDNVGTMVVINETDVPCENLVAAQNFVQEKQQEISQNLSEVANPYLIYSVKSEDNILHPCRSVYVKYGIVVPSGFRGRVPLISPHKHTSIRYEANCTGLREVEWLTGGNISNIQFQCSLDDTGRLPKSWCGKPIKYAFVDCAVFFEETDFARAFRDEMLMQQALRRYVLYGKIEKTW